MRGLATSFVVLAHYVYYVTRDSQLNTIGPFGTLIKWTGGVGVMIFFFLSGYALWRSYAGRPMKWNFLYKRFIRLVPMLVGLRLMLGWIEFDFTSGNDFFMFIKYAVDIRAHWFVEEILIIYILFFITFKVSHRHMITMMAIALLMMSYLYYANGFNERYYNANILFVCGLATAKHWQKIAALYQKHFKAMIAAGLISFLLFSGLFTFFKGNSDLSVILKPIAGSGLMMIMMGLNMYFSWNSRLLAKIGEMSLQVYVAHILIWLITISFAGNMPISICFMVALSLTFMISRGAFAVDSYVQGKLKISR